MAKPDCDDGWYKKSIELEAALDFADFTKIARTILRYGFCQIFGQGRRPKFIRLGCSEVAQRIGKDRQQVFRAFDELVKSGALAPVGNKPDTYRFVKNYEIWTKVRRGSGGFEATEEPRLNRVEVKDCILSPGYSRSFEVPTNADECVSHPDDASEVSDDALSSKRMTKRHPNGLQVVSHPDDKTSSKRMTNGAPPKNPLLGSEIREEEKISLNSTTTPEAGSRPSSLSGLEAWVSEFIDDQQYVQQQLAGWVKAYGVSDTFDALMQAWANRPNRVAAYANTTLRNWHAEGKLPSQLAASAQPQPKATTKPDKVSAFLDSQAEAMKARRARKDAENVQGA